MTDEQARAITNLVALAALDDNPIIMKNIITTRRAR